MATTVREAQSVQLAVVTVPAKVRVTQSVQLVIVTVAPLPSTGANKLTPTIS